MQPRCSKCIFPGGGEVDGGRAEGGEGGRYQTGGGGGGGGGEGGGGRYQGGGGGGNQCNGNIAPHAKGSRYAKVSLKCQFPIV